MATTPIDINIVAKIQKLLEMASRSQGNEQEAAVAMDKAQELLAKYNLDLATIQDHKDKSKAEADGKRGYANISRSAMYEWQRELVGTIAECNFCIAWITQEREPYNKRFSWGIEVAHRNVKRYKILGREGNTMVVLMMVDYLFETIERLLPYQNKDRLSRSAISWRKGVSDRLRHRIIDKYQEMRKADYAKQTDTQYTTALAIVSVDRSEEIANYEFRYGAGSWAEKEARSAKYELELREQRNKLLAERAAETTEQRETREADEAEQARQAAKDWDKTQARWQREADRKRDATDWSAYAKGEEAGSTINLSSQLKNTTNKGVL